MSILEEVLTNKTLKTIPLQQQTKTLCSIAVNKNPYNIEYSVYRNTTDWAFALSADYRLAQFYNPRDRVDITPEEFFDLYLTVTSPNEDLLKFLPKFMWLYDSQIRQLIVRNPKSIFSVPSQEIIETILLTYPEAFANLNLHKSMYINILPKLLEICGLYVKFYCENQWEFTNQDDDIFLAAVRQNGLALEHIPYINDVLVDTALAQNKAAIEFCPLEFITNERIIYCLTPFDPKIVEKCAPKIHSYDIVKGIVEQQGDLIRLFKGFQDVNLQMIAVGQDPDNLEYCINSKENLEVRRLAVQLDGRTLRHCGSYKTKELCMIAFSNAGEECYEYIPSRWRDECVDATENSSDSGNINNDGIEAGLSKVSHEHTSLEDDLEY